jgi:hypothetical protein
VASTFDVHPETDDVEHVRRSDKHLQNKKKHRIADLVARTTPRFTTCAPPPNIYIISVTTGKSRAPVGIDASP